MPDGPTFDRIGYWSEVKLEIVNKYAAAYSTILSAQQRFHHVYIDGFAGAGEHLSKTSSELIPGSPRRALQIQPPFREFFFVDMDGDKVEHLRRFVGERQDVHIHHGDCNRVLLKDVFPHIRFEDYRRALCLLDPYGLDLEWTVISEAGRLRTIDLFLNFPIMDANRNVLWRDPTNVNPAQAARLTRFWGDESWRDDVYRPARQGDLFRPSLEKAGNEEVVEAFCGRLRKVAGFANVPAPIPMRNEQGKTIYYLIFASQNDAANHIVKQIFDKYERREG
jgi:three-Cys-motif partner protein